MFYGRENELKSLEKRYNSEKFEFLLSEEEEKFEKNCFPKVMIRNIKNTQ